VSNGYTSVQTIKDRCRIIDNIDDATLEAVIDAVSRQIDNYTGRRFYTTALDEVRYYTAMRGGHLRPGDVLSIATLETDEDGDRVYETTWAATDYDLEPYNAALDGLPYDCITVTPRGNYQFPVGSPRGVKVTGKFGYCTLANLPPTVGEAAILQCQKLFLRRDAPFGIVAGAEALMRISRLDPDVIALLDAYRLVTVG